MISQWGGKRALAFRARDAVRIPLIGARFVAPVETPVDRLVFVCAGNICRSPFGEYLSRRLSVPSFSMGLRASVGALAHGHAIRQAELLGIDMSGHRSALFDPARLRPRDLVLAFELWHVLEIERAGAPGPVRLLGGFLGPFNFHIHDPYGLGDGYFARCFGTIARGVGRCVQAVGLDAR